MPLAERIFEKADAALSAGQHHEAIRLYDAALALSPRTASGWNARSVALFATGELTEALTSAERGLALHRKDSGAQCNRAAILKELGRLDEAADGYWQALRINPRSDLTAGCLAFCKMAMCAWDDLERGRAAMVARIKDPDGGVVAAPFDLIPTAIGGELQLKNAARFSNWAFQQVRGAPRTTKRQGKIRLGWFSVNFHDHVMPRLLIEVFEGVDRDRFETHAFSFGPDAPSAMRERLKTAFGAFHDVAGKSDADIASAARRIGLDIAIDLDGHTRGSRTGIFAHRPVPVAVNYFGYVGTMGAPYYDYAISDRVLCPDPNAPDYSEQVVRLPPSLQVNSMRPVLDELMTRAECGLPEKGFVFCCFNQSFKISQASFAAWMEILRAVPGSVLWLLEVNQWAKGNLKREAAASGIEPSRLVFAAEVAHEQHLGRLARADLVLDTLPYGAHTTASDALSVGVPVLTRLGDTAVGRLAASLLTQIGMEELIAETPADYIGYAILIARNASYREELRAKLARAVPRLYDAPGYMRRLEEAFAEMHRRRVTGLAPRAFDVT